MSTPARTTRRALRAGSCAADALLIALACAWIVAPRAWLPDLAASWAAQIAAACIGAAAWHGLRWRRSRTRREMGVGKDGGTVRAVRAGMLVLAAAVAAGGLWAAPRAPRAGAGARPDIRVMLINAGGTRSDHRAVLLAMNESGADVIAITEPSGELLELIRRDEKLLASHPHRWLPDNARGGFRVVLTRWPQRGRSQDQSTWTDGPRHTPAGDGLRAMLLDRPEHPGRPVGFVLAHPESPRTPGRWREGNALCARVGYISREWFPAGSPVIVAADLNAGPASSRTRLLASAGLRRCSARWSLTGTWPAGVPAPLRAGIDDVLVSPGVSVASWRSLPGRGSDHRAVLVELITQ